MSTGNTSDHMYQRLCNSNVNQSLQKCVDLCKKKKTSTENKAYLKTRSLLLLMIFVLHTLNHTLKGFGAGSLLAHI